jgi:acyl-CoA thioester hydrolase
VNDQPASPRLAVPRRDEFPHRLVQNIRFADIDRQNHVNNAVFLTFFESGRVDLLYDPKNGLMVPGTIYVLARVLIDYLGELHWPGDVEVATRIAKVGTSSLTLDQALFVGETCFANGHTVLVLIDSATRRPRPFPTDLAARIRRSAPAAPGIG